MLHQLIAGGRRVVLHRVLGCEVGLDCYHSIGAVANAIALPTQ